MSWNKRLTDAEWRVIHSVAVGTRLLGISDATFCAHIGVAHSTFSKKRRLCRRPANSAGQDFSLKDLAQMPGELQVALQKIHAVFGLHLHLPTMADFEKGAK